MRSIILLIALVILNGCMTSAGKLAEVSVGMPKAQVLQILGKPASVSAREDGTELLRFQLASRGPVQARPDGRLATGYTVQIRDGKVVAYGRDDEFRELRVKTD